MNHNLLKERRVLVVEDEMIVAMMLEDMLEELGCEVVGPAAGCQQALEIIEEATPLDAAVLDVNLNGIKSYPVADALTELGVPFAFLTGYEPHSLPNGYRNLPLLRKPFYLEALRSELESMLTSNAKE